MAAGTIKWFNPSKGYGFICPEDGSKEVFLHISVVSAGMLPLLTEGQRVHYDIVQQANRMSAKNLHLAASLAAA